MARVNRFRDPNDFTLSCRIFVGNLASERTSRDELTEVFSKYGEIVDMVVRKSFGFIQFDTPEAAKSAIDGENGRLLGGLHLGMKLLCMCSLVQRVIVLV
jgi:RNA recognition motif-containing protein